MADDKIPTPVSRAMVAGAEAPVLTDLEDEDAVGETPAYWVVLARPGESSLLVSVDDFFGTRVATYDFRRQPAGRRTRRPRSA